MVTRKFGVAILGTGWVSGEHIRAFQRNPHTEVVAVLSRERERAEAKVLEHGLTNCRAYTDLQELLGSDTVDIVSVCTPHHLHAEQGSLAAQTGRHVVVEKPIALTLTELHQLRDAVEKAGVRSVVSFVLRWNPLIENIKAMLADKLIGNIGYAEVDYMHDIGPWYTGYEWIRRKRTGATVMLGGGCHAVDAMRWFLGQDAVEVFSFSAYGHGNRLNYEYETNCITAVKFAGGAIGKIGCSFEWIGPYVFNIVLSGDEGSIRNNQIITKRWPGQNGWATIPAVMPDTAEVSHHPFQAQMDHFVECILGKRESHANVADAVKTHEICIASEISAREGRAVQLPLKHA